MTAAAHRPALRWCGLSRVRLGREAKPQGVPVGDGFGPLDFQHVDVVLPCRHGVEQAGIVEGRGVHRS
ncbi:hypothetical protein FRACA_1520003 [Frankia canadensis]|uniref:Uncharacterized protein n=1 Tax=Frankia canadensis TaxID=1836972 RepID=A0A2I2KM34_9ACTN|nr:hypothetical protein FRACA_1520003 [Frankia canadensis]SOU54014.1 hypothetical protein FRACA_1520003 [Frankia canadensis]